MPPNASNGQCPVIVRLCDTQSGHNWAGPQGLAIPLMNRVTLAGRETPLQWHFDSGKLDKKTGILTLTFTTSEPNLLMRSIWRARPGRGPVQHRLELENRSGSALTLSSQQSLALNGLRTGGSAQLWWVRRGASNATTQGGTTCEPITPGMDRMLPSLLNDPTSPVPWLAVQVGTDRGLYVGWEFSGLGRLQLRTGTQPDPLEVNVGFNPDFRTDLKAGETFQVPGAFVGCYTGDVEEGSYSLHRFVIEKLRPPMPKDYPDPTLAYNVFLDAGSQKGTEADLLRVARIAADLGFETFVPDAMWYPTVGDWRWDPARFPHDSTPIHEFIHGRGMKMGLWCAWTMGGLSTDPGALSVRGPVGHPDWFNDNYPADWKPAPFVGGFLCLGCPDAERWEADKLHWLVRHNRLDYLKHDIWPAVMNCPRKTHRHAYEMTDTSYWTVSAYYRIMDGLLKDFPQLVLENCCAGGHMKDFGAIQRSHYTVVTDTLSNLPDRQGFYDSTYALPPLLLQAYTYEFEYKVPGDDPEPYLWRSAMMGAWQIDPTATGKWTPAQMESARKAAETYKRWIRPILKDVKVFHVLPRPDGVHWDAMFYWSPSLRRGTLYAFHPNEPTPEKAIRLKGLNPGRKYRVWSEDGSVSTSIQTGQQLMRQGITVKLPKPYSSDLIFVQEQPSWADKLLNLCGLGDKTK